MPGKGPPKIPTKILALRGSRLAPTRPNEPPLTVEKPPMPSGLTPAARAIWRKVTTQLYQAGLIARLDGWMLARYCQAWVEWQDTIASVVDVGEDPWPRTRRLLALAAELRRIEQHFGMSPSARASLGTPPPKAATDADHDQKTKLFRRQT